MALEYEEYTEYVDWDFRPYNRIREYNRERGFDLRESVYMRHWQNLLTKHALFPIEGRAIMREDKWFIENESWRYPVLEIFNGFIPSARQTRMASNFILYLSQVRGVPYLDDAKHLSQKFGEYAKPEAYLAQWGITAYTDSDMLSYVARTDATPLFPNFSPTPSYEDLRTLQKMAYWCGTDSGQKFLAEADAFTMRAQKYFAPELKRNSDKRQKQKMERIFGR